MTRITGDWLEGVEPYDGEVLATWNGWLIWLADAETAIRVVADHAAWQRTLSERDRNDNADQLAWSGEPGASDLLHVCVDGEARETTVYARRPDGRYEIGFWWCWHETKENP